MFNNLNKIKDLQEEILLLKDTIDAKNSKIQEYALKDKNATDKLRSSTFIFDFNAVTVFSIERIWRAGRAQTSIGFINPDPYSGDSRKYIEWYFDCDETVHEDLCNQWKEWIKMRTSLQTTIKMPTSITL
jgi:hypothetical protein